MPLTVGLDGHTHYLHWGVIQISLVNLIVIALMIMLLIAALVIPFPGSRDQTPPAEDEDDEH
jgi:hypothetical protein